MYNQASLTQNHYQPNSSMPIHGDGRSRVPVRLNRISTATHSLGSTGSSSSKGHIGIGTLDTTDHEIDNAETVHLSHHASKVLLHGHTMDELAPVKVPLIGRLGALGPPMSSASTILGVSQGNIYGGLPSSSSKDLIGINHQRHRVASRNGTANGSHSNSNTSSSSSSSYNATNKRNKSKSTYESFFNSDNTLNTSNPNINSSTNSSESSSNSYAYPQNIGTLRPGSRATNTHMANVLPNSTNTTGSTGNSGSYMNYPSSENMNNNSLSLPMITGLNTSASNTLLSTKRATSSSSNAHTSGLSNSSSGGNISMTILPGTTTLPSSAGGVGFGTIGMGSGSANIPASSTQHQRDISPFFHEEHNCSSCSSMRGLKPGNPNWTNQDNFFIIEANSTGLGIASGNNSSSNITTNGTYCILDGHGENGHHVSRRCRENFPHYLRTTSNDLRRSFSLMQNDLSMNQDFDARCSGATCVMVLIHGQTITIANCGDSRAVLGRKLTSGMYQAYTLSNDHKPDKPEERKRILSVGGHVGCRQVLVHQPGKGPVSMPVGPCRVWYQHRGETLGLAMSRSLGDVVVHKCGVTAEPEITETTLHEDDEFLILATDGVWDVVDSAQAVQIIGSFIAKSQTAGQTRNNWNTSEASDMLVRLARSRWEKMSPMVDDITAIVVKLGR